MAWLISNLGTIAVVAILVLVVVWIIISLKKDKKSGRSSCGGNCAHCACGCPHAQGKSGK